jgi:hypothetical protein
MVGLIALGVFILLGVVVLWVRGIDEMHEKHPDYKGEDLFGEETKLQCKDCNDNLTDCTCIEDTVDMKQETTADYIDRHVVAAMVEVAKQDLYSKEDMKSSFQVGFNVGYNDEESPSYLTFEEWIKEYKKK